MTCQRETGPATRVRLAAQIDLTNNDRAYDRLYAAFADGADVVVADFTATWFCDCASLRRLLTVQRLAAARGAQLRIIIPFGSMVHRVARLTGLDQQLNVYSSMAEATAWLPPSGGSLRAS